MYSTNWGGHSSSGMASETQDRNTDDRGTQLFCSQSSVITMGNGNPATNSEPL